MKSILIIEDDNLLREILRVVFELNGYRVYEASHGAAGIDSYRKAPADIVITDIVMPGKDGLEVIRDLKRESPGVKIIAISGAFMDANDYLRAAMELGAAYAMRKPFMPSDMLDAVQRILA